MWIDVKGIMRVLLVGETKAYAIVKKLKEEQAEKGYYTNPNAKVPVKYFCERFDLDEDEVRKACKSN